MNGALAGSTYLPTMDRNDQADAIGNDQTSIEREIDPVANHPAIDHLATSTRKGQDKKPERRRRRGFVASLPLSKCLNPESWQQQKGTTPADQLANVHYSPTSITGPSPRDLEFRLSEYDCHICKSRAEGAVNYALDFPLRSHGSPESVPSPVREPRTRFAQERGPTRIVGGRVAW
jgi:hypothetical protein